ncbi:MAG TPA: glycosyltransferase family 39 protein [Dehalococcoidia bacterium]|nr:glycosyltransferase family 39 protein [Dehalococcoidia bacterium]
MGFAESGGSGDRVANAFKGFSLQGTMRRVAAAVSADAAVEEQTAHTDVEQRRAETNQSRRRAMLGWLRHHAIFIGIFLLATYLLTINVNMPWQGPHEDNGLAFESIAISHIRYGLEYTKGQDVLDQKTRNSFGPKTVPVGDQFNYFLTGPIEPVVYGDHPPALGLTIAGSFLAFGYHWWAVRLVPIAYALLGLVLFYRLIARLFDVTVARVASALYATFPILAYYGRNVSHEAPTLFWALLLLTGYFEWVDDGRRRWLAVMGIASVVGGYYGWPLFYFVAILVAMDALVHRRLSRPLILSTLVPAVVTFVLVILQIDWALGWNLHSLKVIFFIRISGGTEGSTIGWLNQIHQFNREDFGFWWQILAPAVAFYLARRASIEGWSRRMQVIAIFGFWGREPCADLPPRRVDPRLLAVLPHPVHGACLRLALRGDRARGGAAGGGAGRGDRGGLHAQPADHHGSVQQLRALRREAVT